MSQVLNTSIPLRVESSRRNISRDAVATLAIRGLVFVLSALALVKGLDLRDWAWAHSENMHFKGDVLNAFYWGTIAVNQSAPYQSQPVAPGKPVPLLPFWRGFVSTYDSVERRSLIEQHEFNLDYTPLRLFAVALWVRQVHADYPPGDHWTPEATRPMLHFNTACELASAIAAFMLVWHWRSASPRLSWILGFTAALLVWFEPSVFIDSHFWPQWDVWLLPFYLWAAFFCSTNRWFSAGILIAIGAMFKGQILTTAPVFALWALFDLKPGYVLRLLCGFACSAALIVSPWLVNNVASVTWMTTVAGAVFLLSIAAWRRRFDPFCLIAFVFAAVALLYPFAERHWQFWTFALVAVAVPFLTPKKWIGVYAMTTLSAAVFLAGLRLGGSWAWYHIGFQYGLDKFTLPAAVDVNNFPAILGVRFNWGLNDPITTIGHWVITLKIALRAVYIFMLVLCALGLTMQARRRSPMALLGFAAPWVLMFAFAPQMHTRYLTWGAAATALCVGISFSLTLLHFLVTIFASITIMSTLLKWNPEIAPKLWTTIHTMNPDIGWLIAFIALIYLYVLLLPTPRRANPA